MKIFKTLSSMIVIASLSAGSALAQRNAPVTGNAALRYWSAFSEIQDSGIADQQAKELNAILAGTAPYDDSKYKNLFEKNTLALEIMARAVSLPSCDWGLDYGLGQDVPVDYARKALVLGRLNVLYIFHLLKTGDKDGAVRALAAGLRFSHDVGNGGSLFAANRKRPYDESPQGHRRRAALRTAIRRPAIKPANSCGASSGRT
jgi:hypothetical protein